jgi:hypothetical protein
MPAVKRFNRCRIEMYFRDHPPPHFHIVTTAGEKVAIEIESLGVLQGKADPRDIAEAITWATGNRPQLRAWWSKYAEGLAAGDSHDPENK